MTECFGDFWGPLVARSDRRPYDRDRLRKRGRDLRGNDREERFMRLAQTRAGIYFGASSVAGRELMLADVRGELEGLVPIAAVVASMPAPLGGVASQVSNRLVLNPHRTVDGVRTGFTRHAADVAWGRFIRAVPPEQLYADSFYFCPTIDGVPNRVPNCREPGETERN